MNARICARALAAGIALLAVSAASAPASVSPAERLAGTYTATLKGPPAAKGLWAFSIAADGEYAIAYKSKVVVRGKATIRNSTIVFGVRREQGALACKGGAAKATYAWSVDGRWVAFKPAPSDSCSGRRLVLARALVRAR